ncbi:MAG: GNAT family N-acetyltransferase [Dysgonomonas sp.]
MDKNIRKAGLDDAAAICNIYNYYIENTTITFETEAITNEAMKKRISNSMQQDLPFYVLEVNAQIAGYYYLHEWNSKQAFATTMEVTVYLDKDLTGKGLGSQLFQHLLANVDRQKIHVLIAGICVPNEESVRLHERFGFEQVSFMKQIARKFNQWCDIAHWVLIMEN